MREFLAITKALSDETRVRALMSLADGELCLCQIIDLLNLAPSTVSKHMTLLYDAQLVERRKEGRWQYYKLAGRTAPPVAKQALRWTLKNLESETKIAKDANQLCCVRKKDLKELTACYNGK